MPKAEFAYNNIKDANTGYIIFELNYKYHPRVFFGDETNSYSRSYSANKLGDKLRELIEICYQNLLNIYKLQKKVHNKGVKNYN